MKKLTYFCTVCKKEISFTTNIPVIPASTLHIECNGQAILRKAEDVKEEPSKS